MNLIRLLGIAAVSTILFGMGAVSAGAAGNDASDASVWTERADAVQNSLMENFWNPQTNMFSSRFPAEEETAFNYWWQAHCIDVLLDGYQRTKDPVYITRFETLLAGVRKRNGGALINDFYDDMEWMALALVRAYDLTGNPKYAESAKVLWRNIKKGWNANVGGGIAWRKSQLDYKNTPANAPAAILALRLYTRFKDDEDLVMAEKIMTWMKARLVDPKTGLVWDGINRQGDGAVDKNWRFTYCQGVYIGACVEMAAVTGQAKYIDDACKTAKYAMTSLIDKSTGLLQDEGNGDGGLFRGILVRYLTEFAIKHPDRAEAKQAANFLKVNAEAVWTRATIEDMALIGQYWAFQSQFPVDLSAHLSGVMLMEAVARIQKAQPSKK